MIKYILECAFSLQSYTYLFWSKSHCVQLSLFLPPTMWIHEYGLSFLIRITKYIFASSLYEFFHY